MCEEVNFEYIAGVRKNSVLVYIPSEKQIYAFKSTRLNKRTGTSIKSYECYEKNCNVRVDVIESTETCLRRLKNEAHSNHGDQESRMKEFKLRNAIKEEVAKPNLQVNKVRTVFNNECEKRKDVSTSVVYKKNAAPITSN